jgi:DNA (cytosine-5)-methyltransferase 1
MDYYSDFDPGAAAWLRELIAGGHIPEGQIDERSILDVEAGGTAGFRRCHWFAGIGGWAEALRLAAWPDAIPVWTGSPPCQPFSAAGKRAGRDDARHLGPAFVDLVRAARPPVLFGEQVASSDVFGHGAKPGKRDRSGAPAWAWCDDLFLRLEAAGYAAWALDIPAAGIGAPHIRQRCFFAAVDLRFAPDGLADRDDTGLEGRGKSGREHSAERPAGAGGLAVGLADAEFARVRPCGSGGSGSTPGSLQGAHGERQRVWPHAVAVNDAVGTRPGPTDSFWRDADWLADGTGQRWNGRQDTAGPGGRLGAEADCSAGERPGPTDGFWRDADWLFCRDGNWRPAGAGIQPLAHGVSGRVGLLRGAGNAIVPQAAAEAIAIARDVMIDTGIWAALCREYAA